MDALFVYYSFEGNCRQLARHMAEATNADTAELVPVKDIPRGVLSKYLAGGKAAFLKETTELRPLAKNIAEYDLIVVGGPVWFFGMTPAVRTFLSETDWNGRKAAVFTMHRGGKGSAAAAMRGLIEGKGGIVEASAEFTDLRRGNPDATRRMAAEWAAGLSGGH